MLKTYTKCGQKKQGKMNKTEELFAGILELEKKTGRIKKYGFEEINFRLADNCFYKPDFYIIDEDDTLHICEVKGGYITQKGKMKFKLAMEKFYFIKWEMWQYKNKQWKIILEN